jgi:ABC-type nitrate/sulfonate/bicarbonate transport system substrate-binding protein
MIETFTKAWFANLHTMRENFTNKHPENYKEIVQAVVEMLANASDNYDKPDHTRVHEIDDGDYQGTLVYVIGAQGYQPSTYWYVKVSYGSCSGCDTLQRIAGYSNDSPNEAQIRDYMTLALHIVQGLRVMGEEAV